MAKALSSMNDQQREAAISRRLKAETGGLGYLSALDANRKRGKIVAPPTLHS